MAFCRPIHPLIAFIAALPVLAGCGYVSDMPRSGPSVMLPVADDATPLDAGIAPLLAAHPGQSGLALVDGDLDAFAWRALSARQAGRSLDLQYYIWRNDLTGRLLVRELLLVADRGVRVRLLLDDLNAARHDRTWLALDSHPQIEVRLFNPARAREGLLQRGFEILRRAATLTRRMHNKAWIADGRLALVGGRNIGDAYFAAGGDAAFRDLDLLLLGPAVTETGAIFDSFWNSRAATPVARLRRPRAGDLPALRAELADRAAEARAQPYLSRVEAESSLHDIYEGGAEPFLYWTKEARVLSDPPQKAAGKSEDAWLIGFVRPLLESAERELAVVSPYFIPGEAGTQRLRALEQKGVAVTVLTNSLAATDVIAVHGAYADSRIALLEAGVRLFELRPYDAFSRTSLFGSSSSASLHTKAFVVDSGAGFVGSMNFDPRSVSLNSEMGVFFRDAALAQRIRAVLAEETAPDKSWRLELRDGDVVWLDADAGGTARLLEDEPEAGLGRRLAAWLIGLLPIRSQL